MKTMFALTLCAMMMISISVSPVHAQNKFKVLAVRGTVTNGSGKALTLGQQLATGDKLTVDKNAYISLAHVNGRTIEVSKKGAYAIADLDKKASAKTKSSTSKFASYVVSELTEVKEPVSFKDDRRTNMRTTGSVERAMGDEVSVWDSVLAVVGGPGELQALAALQSGAVNEGSSLVVISPRHTRLLGDTVSFVWHKTPKAKKFKVVITNRTRDPILIMRVQDTTYTSSIKELNMSRGSLYYWHVEGDDDSGFRSDEFALWYLDGKDRQEAEATMAEVRSDLEAEDDAIGQLILGAAFEDMGLNADAQRAYANAVRIAPDVQNYKRLYADYLRRQGLALDAYVAYK